VWLRALFAADGGNSRQSLIPPRHQCDPGDGALTAISFKVFEADISSRPTPLRLCRTLRSQVGFSYLRLCAPHRKTAA